ncbi:Mfs transporter [Pleurostoma richardsiae]|uniref:Mfs transporter n=1 Tax=Pleurostoma richardsiae TaxID=41990 RepID=A0AA38VED3_9PEZI|nr:Mfs transporter [Pleurostoma richardsiae]
MSGKEEDHHVEYTSDGEGLSNEHREYLLARHGTVTLDPIPSLDDADPLNWRKSKKVINLSLVAFHAMMATFTASAIQCAFVDIAADLHISVQRASYLTSLVIAILGGAPLFWRPVAQAYGRRPIFLISLICSLVCNVGCGLCHSYATMAFCRALTAFFISPAASIGSGVVSEMFFKKERGKCMGIWTTMVTLGVPVAPFIFGFAALRVGYRWIYWTLAITNGVQFILYFFLGSETRYLPNTLGHTPSDKTAKKSYLAQLFSFRRIDPTPMRPVDFIQPLFLARRACVAIPAAAYAMIFLWGSVMITIELPQIFPEQFGFNTQQVGLQFAGVIIGTLLGEQVGGAMSDRWMWRRHKRSGKAPEPEFRLWLSYAGHLLTICGVVVFLVQTQRAGDHWNVTPIIGAGIAAAGNQIVTTVMITYAVDCYRSEAAAIGVFIILVRQIWGFIGPFWFPQMIEKVGLAASSGVATAMMVGIAIVPTMLLQWRGRRWRREE